MLLSAWWIGPFVGNHQYMTDMKYGARPDGASDSFWDMFFPLVAPLDVLVTTLAIIGFVSCIARRHLAGTAVGVITMCTVALVYLTQDSLPVIGLLWNPRLLPFIYLLRYLLMMVGVVEVVLWAVNAWRERSSRDDVGWFAGSITVAGVALAVLVVLGFMFEVLPGAGRRVFHDAAKPVYAWGPFRKTATGENAQGDGWSRYNFLGYEGRPQYPEYYDVVQTMAEIGKTAGLRSRHLGEQRRQRPVRHDHGADAAAALDRRLHGVDGGPVLRGVGHHAVPLPHDRGDVQAELEPGP